VRGWYNIGGSGGLGWCRRGYFGCGVGRLTSCDEARRGVRVVRGSESNYVYIFSLDFLYVVFAYYGVLSVLRRNSLWGSSVHTCTRHASRVVRDVR